MPIHLTGDQIRAIGLLTAGMSARAAAEAVGVVPGTLTQWKRNPHYRAALEAATVDLAESVRARVPPLVDAAISALEGIIKDTTLAPGVRLQAIDMVLEKVASAGVLPGQARALTITPGEGGAAAGENSSGPGIKIVYYAPKEPRALPESIETEGTEVKK